LDTIGITSICDFVIFRGKNSLVRKKASEFFFHSGYILEKLTLMAVETVEEKSNFAFFYQHFTLYTMRVFNIITMQEAEKASSHIQICPESDLAFDKSFPE